tara:strand:+ start:441 stop:683 length:243 start_codon:yes stop_codon:yes gene_type:complete
MAKSGSRSVTVKIDAPIIVTTDGTHVWTDKDWPMNFFEWLGKTKLKLSGAGVGNGRLTLRFVDPPTATMFRMKYDKKKIF